MLNQLYRIVIYLVKEVDSNCIRAILQLAHEVWKSCRRKDSWWIH